MGRATRCLQVIEKEYLTPQMIRIILQGDSLQSFPEEFEGGYVKLCFDQQGQPLSEVPEGVKPVMRSYTIRAFDSKVKTLTLDFADHSAFCEGKGPAACWLSSVQVTDTIAVNGPGAVQRVDSSGDWVLLAGDMTALPAIAVNLERLPANAQGYAVIEILNEKDKQSLVAPPGVELHWIINPRPDQPNTLLVDAVKALPWLSGVPGVWLACEFESMRALRRYFKQDKKLARENLYASSYWKMGETDEGNKRAKKMDAEAS